MTAMAVTATGAAWQPLAQVPDQELVWGAYLRLSRVKPQSKRRAHQRGRMRTPDESTQRQLALIRAHAAAHGLNLPDHLIFEDNGRTAWPRPGKPHPQRPAWDQMIKAGRAGDFQGLLTWKVSRFARSPRDGEDLADLRVVLDGPSSNRFDLRDPTAEGLANFRQQVVAAAQESHQISDRVKDTFADMLAAGYRIGGSGRNFGFEVLADTQIDWDWDQAPDDGSRFLGPAAVYREDEAAAVRELARQLLAGDSLTQLCAWVDRACRSCLKLPEHCTCPPGGEYGWPTVRGGSWQTRTLSRMLANPIYGGYLTYRGEPIGKLAHTEPILDADTYQALQDKLSARKQGRRPNGVYQLTGGGLHCGNPACPKRGTGTLAGTRSRHSTRAYICAPHNGGCGMSVTAGPVEALVRDEVLRVWGDQATREAMARADTALDEQRAQLQATLQALDADLAATEARLGRIPLEQTRRREAVEANLASMAARWDVAKAALDELGPASRRAELPEVLTPAEWDSPRQSPADRVQVIRDLHLRFTVMPSTRPQGTRGFDPARVQVSRV